MNKCTDCKYEFTNVEGVMKWSEPLSKAYQAEVTVMTCPRCFCDKMSTTGSSLEFKRVKRVFDKPNSAFQAFKDWVKS